MSFERTPGDEAKSEVLRIVLDKTDPLTPQGGWYVETSGTVWGTLWTLVPGHEKAVEARLIAFDVEMYLLTYWTVRDGDTHESCEMVTSVADAKRMVAEIVDAHGSMVVRMPDGI